MISADAAFERVADAAAIAYGQAPPYIAYRVDVATDAPSLPPVERHAVTVRTVDGKAIVTSNAGAPSALGDPLPLDPNVDALAQWAFAFDLTGGHVRLSVAYEHPKRYAVPSPAPGDTVVVASVGGYSATYAQGDATHIVLTPATPEERAFADKPDHFVYRDVRFDPVTYLPSQVTLVAPGQTFRLDYGLVQSHWLLERFSYDGNLTAQADLQRCDHVDAVYSDFAFPERVPELAPENDAPH